MSSFANPSIVTIDNYLPSTFSSTLRFEALFRLAKEPLPRIFIKNHILVLAMATTKSLVSRSNQIRMVFIVLIKLLGYPSTRMVNGPGRTRLRDDWAPEGSWGYQIGVDYEIRKCIPVMCGPVGGEVIFTAGEEFCEWN